MTVTQSYDNPYYGINTDWQHWPDNTRTTASEALENLPQKDSIIQSLDETYQTMATLRGRAKKRSNMHQKVKKIAQLIGFLSPVIALIAVPVAGLGVALSFTSIGLFIFLGGEVIGTTYMLGWYQDTQPLWKTRISLWLGADPNDELAGTTPLIRYIRSCAHRIGQEREEREIVQLFIDYGACVNVPDLEENTPLHYAVRGGNVEIVRVLLEAGAYTNLNGKGKFTPIDFAEDEIRTLLVENGNIYPPTT